MACNQAWLLCGWECKPSGWMAAGHRGQLQLTVNKAWDHFGRHKAVLAPVAEHTVRHPSPPPTSYRPTRPDQCSQERHELTAEVHLLYKEVRMKNPGMVESTAARVVLMAYTQANPGPQSLYHSIRDSREKVSYQQQQDWWGKVMLDCMQPLGQVPGAAAYQAVPTTIALSLQALTQPLRTAGWRCVYQCPSSTHGDGLRNAH